jgi:hypothetical protein
LAASRLRTIHAALILERTINGERHANSVINASSSGAVKAANAGAKYQLRKEEWSRCLTK